MYPIHDEHAAQDAVNLKAHQPARRRRIQQRSHGPRTRQHQGPEQDRQNDRNRQRGDLCRGAGTRRSRRASKRRQARPPGRSPRPATPHALARRESGTAQSPPQPVKDHATTAITSPSRGGIRPTDRSGVRRFSPNHPPATTSRQREPGPMPSDSMHPAVDFISSPSAIDFHIRSHYCFDSLYGALISVGERKDAGDEVEI